jgi:CHASE3 domain sensor protein
MKGKPLNLLTPSINLEGVSFMILELVRSLKILTVSNKTKESQMNLIKSITLKIKAMLRGKLAKKYGEYYEACIQAFLTSAFKTLKHADPVKTEAVVTDVQKIFNEIKDFVNNHKDFIKQIGKDLVENMETGPAEKKMKEIVKLVEPLFTNK